MKNKIKDIIVFILLVIAMVLQCLFLKFLFNIITPEDKRNEDNIVMHYTSDGGFDYKVFLKPNEFIDEEYMPSGDAYLLDLIDHININYKYNFSSTKKTKVTGTNKLNIKLIVYYKEYSSDTNKTQVLNKEEVLKEQDIYFDDSEFNYKNNFNLYLDEYLELLDEFQKQIKISVEGFIELTSTTDFSGSINETRYFDKYTNTMKIPLSNSVVKIENNKESKQLSTVYKQILNGPDKNILICTVITNIILFILVCYLIKKVFFTEDIDEYQEEINKILRNYDDIVVNVTTLVDTNGFNIVEISEFKEILNLSRELLLPIMNHEVIKDEETWFYIIKDNILYRYIVKKE